MTWKLGLYRDLYRKTCDLYGSFFPGAILVRGTADSPLAPEVVEQTTVRHLLLRT